MGHLPAVAGRLLQRRSFLILGTTWNQPQPVEGDYAPDRHMAFDLPVLPVTIVLPAGYGVMTNGEYLRRGSFISFDFTPYGGELSLTALEISAR